MSKYKLSNSLDSDKLFIVNLSDIERRIDPNPYHSERTNELKRLDKLDCKKLKTVVTSSKSQTRTIRKDDIYIGLENIKSDTGEYIKTEEKETISSANIFKCGQILFPKLRPYLNKVFLAHFDGICSTEFHVFNTVNLKAEYLAIYLRSSFVVNQTKHLMTGNTLPRLQTEDINNIPVPIISNNRQQKIIEQYNLAFKFKQQKEAEAKKLLESISTYLLTTLGISVPNKDNSPENRVFYTNISEVTNKRFDPDYFSKYYKSINEQIENSIYELSKIGEVVTTISGGKTPASTEYSDEKTEFPIIKVKSYSNEYIDLDKVDYTHTSNSLIAEKGDIFILSAAHQAEYVGRFLKYLNEEPEIDTSYVGELICIRTIESECNSMFLFSLLNTEIFKTLLNREKTGQTSHIYGKDIKRIKIPLPNIEKQEEIANHINDLRVRAKQLEIDANDVMKIANKKIEKLILEE
jgi:restriction endonuclease S subunit